MDDSNEALYLFRPVKLLGTPSVIAPFKNDKVSISLQFIIPNLHISNREKGYYKQLIKKCHSSIWDSDISNCKSKAGAPANLVTVAFYFDNIENDVDLHQAIENNSHIFIERFLGLLSYVAGVKLSGVNIVNTIVKGNKFRTILNAASRTESPNNKFSVPRDLIEDKAPSDEIFTALFWLRRGLAESDPIDTYNALMVSLQILARNSWEQHKIEGETLPTPTALFRDYLIKELGATPDQVKEAWKKRNSIAAHGNKLNIDSNDFIGLVELKFEAINWAYKGISLALGLDLKTAPRPSQNLFATSALMNLD